MYKVKQYSFHSKKLHVSFETGLFFHSGLTSGKFIPLKSTSKILWVAYKSIFPIWTLVLVKLSRLTLAAMQKKDKLFIFPLMPTSHDQLHLKMLRHLQAYSTK